MLKTDFITLVATSHGQKKGEEMMVFWLSRHDLSPAQLQAIRDLHGEDAEVLKDPVVFNSIDGLAEYIRNHLFGFVYAVASGPHYIATALSGFHFGVFENHPQKRQDGSFGLSAVYHVNVNDSSQIEKVWMNPDPTSDKGEALIPVAR
ncbi:MAG: hypothetical protein Q7S82_02225 [bacterium]|nr:hypothetical protein [bacterium]